MQALSDVTIGRVYDVTGLSDDEIKELKDSEALLAELESLVEDFKCKLDAKFGGEENNYYLERYVSLFFDMQLQGVQGELVKNVDLMVSFFTQVLHLQKATGCHDFSADSRFGDVAENFLHAVVAETEFSDMLDTAQKVLFYANPKGLRDFNCFEDPANLKDVVSRKGELYSRVSSIPVDELRDHVHWYQALRQSYNREAETERSRTSPKKLLCGGKKPSELQLFKSERLSPMSTLSASRSSGSLSSSGLIPASGVSVAPSLLPSSSPAKPASSISPLKHAFSFFSSSARKVAPASPSLS